ncbi:alpha/beta hydrolase [Saccharothrix sp. AJ9571]|nr:alpha/beta hydrolase [Saccharothrix sp. AJ9571]
MTRQQRRSHRVRWDVVAGDRRVRSLEAGPPHRATAPVVLVPELGALGYLLDTVDACSTRSRAFLLDVPGFGHRPPRPCPAEVPAVGETVGAWLSAVPTEPVVLVGHSTGAQAALHAAVAAPHLVRALVLIGPTIPPALGPFPALVRAFVRNSRHEPPGEIPVTWPYYLRGGPRLMTRFIRSARQDRPERLIGAVSCPTLLIRGEHDAFAPRTWLDQLAAACPNARTETAPGAHAFPYQYGGLTAELIAGAAH